MSDDNNLVGITAHIVAAYVERNALSAGDLPGLISTVHGALAGLDGSVEAVPQAGPQKPAVPVKRSITPDYLICLEDGKQFKSLKRHLATKFGMTPQDYRAKWGLAKDYPMVAPAYAQARSDLAKKIGLGAGGRKPAASAATAPAKKAPVKKK